MMMIMMMMMILLLLLTYCSSTSSTSESGKEGKGWEETFNQSKGFQSIDREEDIPKEVVKINGDRIR